MIRQEKTSNIGEIELKRLLNTGRNGKTTEWGGSKRQSERASE
jgi:hypothetical protein